MIIEYEALHFEYGALRIKDRCDTFEFACDTSLFAAVNFKCEGLQTQDRCDALPLAFTVAGYASGEPVGKSKQRMGAAARLRTA